MDRIYKLPLLLEVAEEGGWIVRSPVIPELITEIDHLDEIDDKLKDAVAAVKELYEDMGKEFPISEIEKPIKYFFDGPGEIFYSVMNKIEGI